MCQGSCFFLIVLLLVSVFRAEASVVSVENEDFLHADTTIVNESRSQNTLLQSEITMLSPEDTVLSSESAAMSLDDASMQPKKKKKNFFVKFFEGFNNYDTNYIEPNHYNFALMVQNTNFYQTYTVNYKTSDDVNHSIRVAPKASFRVGPFFGWRWLFFGYTFDLIGSSDMGGSHDFNLSLYSSQLGFDLLYIKHNGDCTIKSVDGFDDTTRDAAVGQGFSGIDSYTLGVNAYYVFNHKHFSYPAAYSQSTVQRISCGSWMLGLRYDYQEINFDYSKLPAVLQGSIAPSVQAEYNKVDYTNYSISFGYAYNWVFARNMLFNVSLMPSIGYKQRRGEHFQQKVFIQDVRNFNFDLISRAGIVWNNTRWFAGVSYIGHLYNFREQKYSFINNINYLNLYVGFNFLRRKQ